MTIHTDNDSDVADVAGFAARTSERATSWLLIIILAWAPMPLGSARPWSQALLVLLVAVTWLVWLPSGLLRPEATMRALRRAAVPILLMTIVLVWALIQASPWTPMSWHQAVWKAVAASLGNSRGTISINPFDTITEVMKLASYIVAGWLAFVVCAHSENADRLLRAIFFIGLFYALYGLVLNAMGTSQVMLLEGHASQYGNAITSAFGAKNNFATFAGVSFLAGLILLVRNGAERILPGKTRQHRMEIFLKFLLGKGAIYILGLAILMLTLIGAQSRAGIIAVLVGCLVAFGLSIRLALQRKVIVWVLVAGAVAIGFFLLLLMITGDALITRFDNLIEIGSGADLRATLWQAAKRAIFFHSLRGIGLGAYHDAYNLYASGFVPYEIDRAHNDYLELMAGLGLPAAGLWLLAMLLIVWRCALGVLRRQRRQSYAIAALAGIALVGFHSMFDFSMQIPADALQFALLLGMGAAQSYPSARRNG